MESEPQFTLAVCEPSGGAIPDVRQRVAYETVKGLMTAAAFEDALFRPGMGSVEQTFVEAARFHPHVHGMCTRGGWDECGHWVAVPFIDTQKAEELSRYRVLRLL